MLTETVTAMETVNREARELDSSADTREHREERKGLSSGRLPVSPGPMSVSALIQFPSPLRLRVKCRLTFLHRRF